MTSVTEIGSSARHRASGRLLADVGVERGAVLVEVYVHEVLVNTFVHEVLVGGFVHENVREY